MKTFVISISLVVLLAMSFTVTVTVTVTGPVPALAQSTEAQQMLALVNAHRVANGASPVCFNTLLNDAALRHSTDMHDNNHPNHIGTDGTYFWDRVNDTGYTGTPRAENIAWGSTNTTLIFDLWRNSPDHNTNMLLSDANEIGIAHVGGYWTQVFGRRSGACNLDVDMNEDNNVSPVDAVFVLNRLNTTHAEADVDNSGTVTQLDFDIVMLYIGQPAP